VPVSGKRLSTFDSTSFEDVTQTTAGDSVFRFHRRRRLYWFPYLWERFVLLFKFRVPARNRNSPSATLAKPISMAVDGQGKVGFTDILAFVSEFGVQAG